MRAFNDDRGNGVELTDTEFSALYKLALAALQNFESLDESIAEMTEAELSQLVRSMHSVIVAT